MLMISLVQIRFVTFLRLLVFKEKAITYRKNVVCKKFFDQTLHEPLFQHYTKHLLTFCNVSF